MRILLATDHYPPYIGGAQIQSQLLARWLRDRGHTVAVATVWQNELPAYEEDAGIQIYRLRQLRTAWGLARIMRQRHYQPPFPDPVTIFGLRSVIARFDPDLVDSYGWISYSVSAALLATDIPLLLTARDYGYGCAKQTLMRNGQDCSGPALLKCVACAGRHYGRPKGWIAAAGVLGSRPLLRRKVSGVHSVSTYVRTIVRRDFLDERGSNTSGHVIHDVIGSVPDLTPEIREAEHLAVVKDLPDEPFMLFIGALRRIKGVFELFEAYESLDNPPPLVLLGTKEPDSPTEFPPGVLFLEDVPHDAVMAIAASPNCLFGVMPSIWPEPFGTVVCEVMSRGKPVIGTAPGGHADMIIDGENGLLVPRGDVQALANAMRLLLADTDLRERLGVAARTQAETFTPELKLPQVERLYEQLVARRPPRGRPS